MTPDAKSLIKSLVQQCNIESISTKDLSKELGDLYTTVEALERRNKDLTEIIDAKNKELSMLNATLAQYKKDYVTPVDEIAKQQAALKEERFKFDTEKKFAEREVEIYKELVRALTCTKTGSENYYGGNNGSSWGRSESADKPCLPGAPFSGPVK